MRYRITTRHRLIGATRVADPVVHLAGKRLVLDEHVPADIARLVPARWGNAPHTAWLPLIHRAIARGLL